MAETKIEWTAWQDGSGDWRPGFTFNPWIGCQKVSPACDLCYAETLMDTRYKRVKWGQRKTDTTRASVGTRVRTAEDYWRNPERWARIAREQGGRPKVFCASLADWLDNQVERQWRFDLCRKIDATPELDWLLLTKRPENFLHLAPRAWTIRMPPNVWFGFSAEDQEWFDRRWSVVRDIPAAVRFCSYEPACGPLRLFKPEGWGHADDDVYPDGLHWLICGGESGPGHRDMDMAWERDIRADCAHAGVAYYFKQLPGKKPIPANFPLVRQFPERSAA